MIGKYSDKPLVDSLQTGDLFLLERNSGFYAVNFITLSGQISGGGGGVGNANAISGALSERLGSTGSYLFGLINASSAGVSSVNSASGALSIVGAGTVHVTTAGQQILVSGDTSFASGYSTLFTTGDWISSGAFYYLSVNHSLNSNNLIVDVQDLSNPATSVTYVDKIEHINVNTVRLRTLSSPDLRFSGRVVLGFGGGVVFSGSGGSSSIGVSGISVTGGTNLIGNLSLTGVGNISIVALGNTIRFSGDSTSTSSSSSVLSGDYLILNGQTGNVPHLQNAAELFHKKVASKSVFYFNGNTESYGLAPTFWDKQIQMLNPSNATALTSVGNNAVSLGTVSHSPNQTFGSMANFASAATPNAQAGTSFNIANLFLGNVSGENGFLLVSKFGFPDSTGTYMSGNETGVRFFFGVISVSLSQTLAAVNAAGNRAGISFIKSSGGASSGRDDTNFMFSTKDGTTETLYNTNMQFNSGLYRSYIFLPTYPNTGSIYWQIDDVSRGLKATGIAVSTLPDANTAMRGAIGIHSVDPVAKNLRLGILYVEV